ncbi:choice-of-anchor M domain-containing protein [Streptomyces sp. NPDC014779]|uniref:choice-of-anchor M domain-containing protein n=1 Tax=Streptomyces sp. NPDC014779 TaxID=3364911 RepID=UPI0036F7329C
MSVLTHGRRAVTVTAATLAAVLLTAAAGLVAAGSGTAHAGGGAVVLAQGDIDLVPQLADGRLDLRIADRTGHGTVPREPADVVLHVVPEAKESILSPVNPVLGDGLYGWFLNGRHARDVFALTPAWTVLPGARAVEVTLDRAQGEGRFALYTFTEEMEWTDQEPVQHLNSEDPGHRSFRLPQGTERFAPTWGFAAEGVHRLTLTVTATLADGSEVSDTETLAVAVGSTDPTRVRPGDGSTPTATPTPTTSSTPTPTPPPSGTATPSPSAPAGYVIDDGHIDLAARPVSPGKLAFRIKDGTLQNPRWHDPEDVVIHVRPAAKRRIGEAQAFLGTPGDPVWWLPSSRLDGLVWPGWNTEEFPAAQVKGRISYRLDALQGPGRLAVVNDNSLDSTVLLDSGNGLPDAFEHTAGSHSHSAWAFTKEGVYRTVLTVAATLADGTKVSDTATIAWAVGTVDPTTVRPGPGDGPVAPTTAPPGGTPTTTPSTSPSAPAPGGTDEPPAGDGTAGGTNGQAATAGSAAAGTSGTGSATGGATDGRLASTGAPALLPVGLAAAAVGAGAVAFLAARRRRRAEPPEPAH